MAQPFVDSSTGIHNNEKPADAIWEECLKTVKQKINSQSFRTWFEPVKPLDFDGERLSIEVPSQFFYEWLEEHYYQLIHDTMFNLIGTHVRLEYTVREDEYHHEQSLLLGDGGPAGDSDLSDTRITNKKSFIPAARLNVNDRQEHPSPAGSAQLNPRYTFDNFIKGDSNQFARAAALAVANNPGGTSFNPLVVYGGLGLGKTHLIQALGNQALELHNDIRVCYVSSEKFTIDFVDAIQSDRVGDFSMYYRSMDLLIVDDIQFFSGKEKTQDNFFHTFNTLHQLGKQIVLSIDRPPKELRGLDERLISRFQWGLTADIQAPDLETRIAILKMKSIDDGIDIPQEVIDFIAVNVTSNIRELEGCLISLLAKASLDNREMSIDLAREVLQVVVSDIRSPISIEEIQRIVCQYFNIPDDLIRAKTRKHEIVNARQIAMYLVKELTNSSLKTIGLHFGGRDHSTVIHSCQSVEEQMKVSQRYRDTVIQIKRKIEISSGR
jgi:chromosomal replication initiator protein